MCTKNTQDFSNNFSKSLLPQFSQNFKYLLTLSCPLYPLRLWFKAGNTPERGPQPRRAKPAWVGSAQLVNAK